MFSEKVLEYKVVSKRDIHVRKALCLASFTILLFFIV